MTPAAASTTDFLTAIASAGFPVAVAAFLLMRLEKRLESLTRAIEGLRRCQVCRLDEPDAQERAALRLRAVGGEK